MCSLRLLLAAALVPLVLAQVPTSCVLPLQTYYSQLDYRPSQRGSFINQVSGNFPPACTVSSRVSFNPQTVSTDPSQPIAVDTNGNTLYMDQSMGIMTVQHPASPRLFLALSAIPSRVYTVGPGGIYFLVSTQTGAYIVAYSFMYTPASLSFNASVDPTFNIGNCRGNATLCSIDQLYNGVLVLTNAITGAFYIYDTQYGSYVSSADIPNSDFGPYFVGQISTTASSATIVIASRTNVYAFDSTLRPAPLIWTYPIPEGEFTGMTMTQRNIFLTSGPQSNAAFTVLDPTLGLPVWQTESTSCTPIAMLTNCTILCYDADTAALGSLQPTNPPAYTTFPQFTFAYRPPFARVLVDSAHAMAAVFETGGGTSYYSPKVAVVDLSNMSTTWAVSFTTRSTSPSLPALAVRPSQTSGQNNLIVMSNGPTQGSVYFLGAASYQCPAALPV